ncbi:manganese/iron transport system substrate-binding protein [Vreelandella songnenensis]|uniref:Manganese/iron transport system substrate-binding protein n=1 Tax=Vreelandella songnenensis TaxID=1176243 RepID=A0A2T0V6C3_9GAMM|nr:zinc ABC transporter substrate-binding protein [Halomonas songnenensis]PRY65745.1 manganese/iron transport system substrate-binding protein [Halomonas songnenensis]
MSQRRAWLKMGVLMAAVSGMTTAYAEPLSPPVNVVATFSVLGDLVARVAGDDAHVSVLTPVNAEVHEWELTPDNFAALEDADIVFYNGYQLEQWMRQLEATIQESTPIIPVAEDSGYPTQHIAIGELKGDVDPHMWTDPRAAIAYVKVIADELETLLPEQADAIQARAGEVEAELEALHEELQKTLADIPESRRVLLTSEAAFLYFSDAYGFEHDGIWGNNAETEGSPRQLMRVIDMINERQPAAMFWESTTSDRYVSSLAEDTGIPVAGPLYVDSLSEPDGEAGDYFAMQRHNAELLHRSLKGE